MNGPGEDLHSLHRIGLAWHDVTCAEGPDCRGRALHAQSQPLAYTGVLGRFLDRYWDLQLDALRDGAR